MVKRSYHTDVIVQYKLGILPKEIIRQIPSSTLDNWKNRALKAFGISYQQYYAWKNKKNCIMAQEALCRKIYHNQLTAKEVNTISKYLIKPEYRN